MLFHRAVAAGLVLAGVLGAVAAETCAQETDEEDIPAYRSGLLGSYVDQHGTSCLRIEETLTFDWGAGSPDARMAVGPFTAEWQGFLLVQSPGEHELYAHAAGEVAVWLDGEQILSEESEQVGWLRPGRANLAFGYHPLRIIYRSAGGAESAFGIYWSGPGFVREPIPAQFLFHAPEQGIEDAYFAGQELARSLRCGACHQSPQSEPVLPAPALTNLAGNLRPEWLVAALSGRRSNVDPRSGNFHQPGFALSDEEARAITAWLFSQSKLADEPALKSGDAASGDRLFHSLGCLACHRVGDLGNPDRPLDKVASRRPAGFFSRWLAGPEHVNVDHQMPVFPLSDQERADLAAWLQTLGGPVDEAAKLDFSQRSLIAEGRLLVRDFQCGACHRLLGPAQERLPLRVAPRDNGAGCTAKAKGRRPGYRLGDAQALALLKFFANPAPGARAADDLGQRLLQQHACLKCHDRNAGRGLSELAGAMSATRPDLAGIVPALAPPPLTGVGDKLPRKALIDSITRKSPPLRPWLAVRMPRYDLPEDDLTALVDWFQKKDLVPSFAEPPVPQDEPQFAGGRLVAAEGFGCTSCHALGGVQPQNVPLAAQGSDLSQLGKRVRRSWFDRWVRDPARIIPRMEMPAIQTPVRGVLDEQLDQQLAAVWHVLNEPGFRPPQPNPVRTVRRLNRPEADEHAIALWDVVDLDGRSIVSPLLIALPNRHNVLFDMEQNQLAGWWLGDAARQYAGGKRWHWAPGGTPLFKARPESDILLKWRGEQIAPFVQGQWQAILDGYEHVSGGLEFTTRLAFALPTADSPTLIRVRQTIWAEAGQGGKYENGFRRRLEFEGLPQGAQVQVDALASVEELWSLETIRTLDAPGAPSVNLRIDRRRRPLPQLSGRGMLLTADAAGQATCDLEYSCTAPSDRFDPVPPVAEENSSLFLPIAPGFEAARLPLPRDEMPTGLAWRPDGTLVFCSLKGRVLLARDSDGDGLEDRLAPFSDELSAPYGVAAAHNYIDVIHKHALLRLFDEDDDGHADRMQVLADGWGVTADYHDWAVGLPRDSAGRYYVGLPCQQDDRSPAAARWRGTVLRLTPQASSAADPRRFTAIPFSGGLRFPMGLALNDEGELFATDNQGNYNPFNELNHLQPDARYGFINKLEQQAGAAPPYLDPAIEIPHPWTRSVNGICFLPPDDATMEQNPWGPFAGHLIGCEYDTRRLVRMSLESCGDLYQGAAYPFSITPAAGAETLEGPVACAVSPAGDLYVANLRDGGWGAGQNTGSVVRVRPAGPLPLGIAEVQALPDGFLLIFTAPVDAAQAVNRDNYSIYSYRRVVTPAYGGPDLDAAPAVVLAAERKGARRVHLKLAELRPGFVYEFHLKSLAADGADLFPAEAYYTLRRVPEAGEGGAIDGLGTDGP